MLGNDSEAANVAGKTTVALRDCSESESDVCREVSCVVRRTRCIDVVDVCVLMA